MEQLLEKAKQLSVSKLQGKRPKYKRFLFDELVSTKSMIAGVYGARGSGKTTILLQAAASLGFKPSEMLYISFDHPVFKGVSLFEFVDYYSKTGGKFLLIDEIHDADNFEQELKSVYDFVGIKILFSGSSAVRLTNPDLARRYAMFYLPALSLREYIELDSSITLGGYELEDIVAKHEDIAFAILGKLEGKKILEYFRKFLEFGAYPYYFEDRQSYLQKLIDTINMTIDTDLGQLFFISPDKIDILKKLLVTICRSQPLELSIDKLSSSVGISKTTLYKYLEYLQKGELLRIVPHELKRHKQIRKADKLYLHNTNLFTALCLNTQKGTLRESFFAQMVGVKHTLNYCDKGDFIVDELYTVEIGGKSKDFSQIKDIQNSFIAMDEIESGHGNKIPLWMFGFLY
jgi:uncharacterized protein